MIEKSHKNLVQREITVKRGEKSFKQMRWVKSENDKLESKKESKSKGSFNIGDSIVFKNKNLKIEKVSESQKTAKLSNGKIYTFDAINKIKSIKTSISKSKKETKVKDLKPTAKKEIKVKKLKLIPKKSDKKINKSIINPKFNEDGFVFKSKFNKKISINKSELSKAVSVSAQSGDSGYAFVPINYDKKDKKFEDSVVADTSNQMKEMQKKLEVELKQLYNI